MFKVGNKVCSVKNAAKIGKIAETGLSNEEGIQWVAVLWEGGKTPRWKLADCIRDFSDIRSVPVPDGVIVLARKGHYPEVFQQPKSKATLYEVQAFADAIYKMWANRLGKVLPA